MGSGKDDVQDFDWDRTSFEGAQREQLRRWAQLPLEEMILALEEMQELADQLAAPNSGVSDSSEESGSETK